MADNSSAPSATAPVTNPSNAQQPANALAPTQRPKRADTIISSGPSVPTAPQPTFLQGLLSISPSELLNIPQVPCARDALLTGIGTGFAVGGLHFVLRGNAWRASNWFVGSWALASAGGFKFCQVRKEMERAGMGRAMEIMEAKRLEKKEEMERAREQIRVRREEERRLERERARSWRAGWSAWFGREETEVKPEDERREVEIELRLWEQSQRIAKERKKKEKVNKSDEWERRSDL